MSKNETKNKSSKPQSTSKDTSASNQKPKDVAKDGGDEKEFLAAREAEIVKKYKRVTEGSIRREGDGDHAGKLTVEITCASKDCGATRRVATSDLFQVKHCKDCTHALRQARRRKRAKDARKEDGSKNASSDAKKPTKNEPKATQKTSGRGGEKGAGRPRTTNGTNTKAEKNGKAGKNGEEPKRRGRKPAGSGEGNTKNEQDALPRTHPAAIDATENGENGMNSGNGADDGMDTIDAPEPEMAQ